MLIALILASGKGTRLAPLSTKERPKQYLSLVTENTLVEDTANRVTSFIEPENIFVVTNEAHEDLANDYFNYLPKENIILEPFMKETLASISHAFAYISKIKGDDIEVLVLPSDHYIDNLEAFKQSVLEGHKVLLNKNNYVLYGVKPTHPSTEYGYIQTKTLDDKTLEITSFVEKPKLEVATELVKHDNYYWNNGIMLFTKKMLFDSIQKQYPEQFKLLEDYTNNKITTLDFFNNTIVGNFSRLVLEHESNMNLIEANYLWYDVGGFDALFEILEKLEFEEKLSSIKKQLNTLK